jgi:hypothetical protein
VGRKRRLESFQPLSYIKQCKSNAVWGTEYLELIHEIDMYVILTLINHFSP